MTISKIRVYLLDDHEVVRQGVRRLLEAAGDIEVIGESGSAILATQQISALRPDVAILDARLPDGSGIAVCREVRSFDPGIRAIFLTSYDDDRALFASILAGASGYVLKELNDTKLLNGIRTVAGGGHLIGHDLMARVLEQAGHTSAKATGPADLTAQELELLTLITHGLTDRVITDQMPLDLQKVRQLVRSIMTKVGLEGDRAAHMS